MRFAINVPNFGDYADPEVFLRLAREAEESGWDGLFVWDHILVDPDWAVPIADPWVLLTAAATVTRRSGGSSTTSRRLRAMRACR